MSSEVEWTLRCDEPGCSASVVARGVHDELAQRKVCRLARDIGWQSNELGDFCVEHKARSEG